MITVLLKNSEFCRVSGSPTLTSLDGQLRAPLPTILADSWTAQDREAFGVYQVDVTPPEGYVWTGQINNNDGIPEPVFEPVPPPSAQDVIEERRRRLAAGFDYDFGDERGVHRIGTSDDDMIGWDEVTKGAYSAIALGQPNTPIMIVTDTGAAQITAMEWQSILAAAAQFRQPIWQASFALQAMTPIPHDYADDKYWTQQVED